jgi:hypothetical protein
MRHSPPTPVRWLRLWLLSGAHTSPARVHGLAVSMEVIPDMHGRRCWELIRRECVAQCFDVMKNNHSAVHRACGPICHICLWHRCKVVY